MGVARVLPLHMQPQAQHGHTASVKWNEGKSACHRAARKRMSGVGSWFVQSPELLKGEQYDERSDVFSYGLLCATLLSGMAETELPRGDGFGLDTEALIEHCAGALGIGAASADPPFGDDVFSALLLQIAHECCALQPELRPAFAQIQSRVSIALECVDTSASAQELTLPPRASESAFDESAEVLEQRTCADLTDGLES